MNQVPLCYVYMTRRKTRDYTTVMRSVLSLIPEANVEECVLDFEKAMWSSIRDVLPNVEIHGCWFHWSQAVYRKVKKLGLQSAYVNQLPVRRYISQLMALHHLPANHIMGAFSQLKARCPTTVSTEELQKLVTYLEKTWVNSEDCPPSSWLTYKRAVRTNNDAKGWHHSINTQAKTNSLNMYKLFGLLHKESEFLLIQVHLVSQTKLYRFQKKSTKDRHKTLTKLWAEYEAKQFNTSEYLRLCSELVDHSEEHI